jgi:NAD(P)-dependent dehydrogenase (short-subunit alcohol dehydrogenase family)
MAERFEGKVALVTGAASGIGLAMVERFVSEGARVLAADIQDEKGAGLAARFAGAVVYRRCDVTEEADIAAAVESAVAAFGGLDVLCNNAGSGGTLLGPAEMDLAAWRNTFDLLLTSVVAGVRYAVPHMTARGGGAIVNTSSITALQAGYGPIAYSTAKAAVLHFTKLAAADLSALRIRINAICPGLIATSIFGASLGMPRPSADQMAALIAEKGGAMQPIGRAGAPEDIAAAAAFLASDEAGFVTGAHLVVDGGITIGPRSAWDPESPSPFLAAMGIDPAQAAAMRAAMMAKPQS